MEKKERFKNIDFLKFLATILIVLFHVIVLKNRGLCHLYSVDIPLYKTLIQNASYMGSRWVEFFFILSGFFFALNTNFAINFIDFFKKKIIRLWPVVMFSILVCMVLSWFDITHYAKYENVFNMLLLNGIGVHTKTIGANSHSWYVSSMFWGLMFYFYLSKLINQKWMNLLYALIALFGYSYVVHTTINAQKFYCNFINIGMLIALAGIAIGYFIALWFKKFKNNPLKTSSFFQKILFTLTESYLLVFAIQNTIFHKISYDNWLIILPVFVGLIILFLMKKGFISQFFDNNFSAILGKYVYSIYIMHFLVHDVMRKVFWMSNKEFIIAHPIFNLILPIIIAILLGILTYHLVEQPAARYLNKLWFNKENKNPTNSVGGLSSIE